MTWRPVSPVSPSAAAAAAIPIPLPVAKSRFSFDQLLRRLRPTLQGADAAQRQRQRGQDKKKKKEPSKRAGRPPPLATAEPTKSLHSHVRLCQSPGGRANVTLAIPVTPQQSPRELERPVSGDDDAVDDELRAIAAAAVSCRSSSFSFGPWRDSEIVPASTSLLRTISTKILADLTAPQEPALLLPPGEPEPEREREQDAVAVFLAQRPRDLAPDPRRVCAFSLESRAALLATRRAVSAQLRRHVFEIQSTRWAGHALRVGRQARRLHRVTPAEALSLRFVVCALVRHEVESRRRVREAQEKQFQRKMTEYRVAMQCICGATVVKYGRKGRPHSTHLMIENGDTLRWTSKHLSLVSSSSSSSSSSSHGSSGGGGGGGGGLGGPGAAVVTPAALKKMKKSIALSSIVAVRAGPTTDVLVKAVQKGTLRLQDAKCTLSLVTPARTFDLRARDAAEREWLQRSFTFLIALAREHERQVAQQAELAIMKRLEAQPVWKHGRRGRPHKTRLFVNRFGEISWQGRSGDTIQLEDVRAVAAGLTTAVFARSRSCGFASPAHAARCFSLVTPTRSLDIETESEQQRDWYVVAFRYLLDKVHEKTAALRREKAERQLRLLQELCGHSGHLHNSNNTGGSGAGPLPPTAE
ncbi:hypothetical protein ATCC90586_005755 [Pythium insidiosum]|nr:hypothetical protein ATCC90586_005755 [Pythium insidiosum]